MLLAHLRQKPDSKWKGDPSSKKREHPLAHASETAASCFEVPACHWLPCWLLDCMHYSSCRGMAAALGHVDGCCSLVLSETPWQLIARKWLQRADVCKSFWLKMAHSRRTLLAKCCARMALSAAGLPKTIGCAAAQGQRAQRRKHQCCGAGANPSRSCAHTLVHVYHADVRMRRTTCSLI
jgi:hypothetical protein